MYANSKLDKDADDINAARYALLAEQLAIYDRYQIHWSIWLYKDIGLQGMLHTAPESPWMRLLQPFLDKKRRLQLDAWGKYPSPEAEAALRPLVEWIDSVSPTAKQQYPTPWATERHLLRATFLQSNYRAAQLAAAEGLCVVLSIISTVALAQSAHEAPDVRTNLLYTWTCRRFRQLGPSALCHRHRHRYRHSYLAPLARSVIFRQVAHAVWRS